MIHPDVALQDPWKFDERYIQHCQQTKTYKEAYFKTERDYRAVFGENKYSTYGSYRNSRSTRLKRKRERKAAAAR